MNPALRAGCIYRGSGVAIPDVVEVFGSFYHRGFEMKMQSLRKWLKRGAGAAGLTAAGTVVALASTGGPFSAMNTFVSTNLLPGVASIGILGGLGYAAIHAFKHDYGKATLGMGVAAGGGFIVSNSAWVVSQTGVSSATIGAHLPLMATALHALAGGGLFGL